MVKYRDWTFFPALIVLMDAFNLLIVYPTIIFNAPLRFLVVLAEDTFEVMICWLVMRQIIFLLDRRLPYSKGFALRLLVQLGSTLLVCCTLLLLQTYLIMLLRRGKPLPDELFTHHIWVYAIWIVIHNAIYTIIYIWQWNAFIQRQKESANLPLEMSSLVTTIGNRSNIIQLAQVRLCSLDGELSFVLTADNQKFPTEKSLDSLAELLPSSLFFRTNRQTIVHRQLISGIERIGNGKLKVLLGGKLDIPGQLIVSRTKAPAFKAWLKATAS